jgi:hypothetical protein
MGERSTKKGEKAGDADESGREKSREWESERKRMLKC